MPKIEIVAYRAEWTGEYCAIAERLRAAAGPQVLALHHIGSTSVPGLAAKDIVDIQITVAALEPPLPLEAAGFRLGPHRTDHCPPGLTLPPIELEKRFFKQAPREANIHVRVRGRFNQRYPLLWRDYMRSHPSAAHAYEEIKKQLARRFPDDVEAYYDIKNPVFDIVMAGAEDWAAATSWQEPPSD